jgi:hypothetical protein
MKQLLDSMIERASTLDCADVTTPATCTAPIPEPQAELFEGQGQDGCSKPRVLETTFEALPGLGFCVDENGNEDVSRWFGEGDECEWACAQDDMCTAFVALTSSSSVMRKRPVAMSELGLASEDGCIVYTDSKARSTSGSRRAADVAFVRASGDDAGWANHRCFVKGPPLNKPAASPESQSWLVATLAREPKPIVAGGERLTATTIGLAAEGGLSGFWRRCAVRWLDSAPSLRAAAPLATAFGAAFLAAVVVLAPLCCGGGPGPRHRDKALLFQVVDEAEMVAPGWGTAA